MHPSISRRPAASAPRVNPTRGDKIVGIKQLFLESVAMSTVSRSLIGESVLLLVVLLAPMQGWWSVLARCFTFSHFASRRCVTQEQ